MTGLSAYFRLHSALLGELGVFLHCLRAFGRGWFSGFGHGRRLPRSKLACYLRQECSRPSMLCFQAFDEFMIFRALIDVT